MKRLLLLICLPSIAMAGNCKDKVSVIVDQDKSLAKSSQIINQRLIVPSADKSASILIPSPVQVIGSERLIYKWPKKETVYMVFLSTNPAISNLSNIKDALEGKGFFTWLLSTSDEMLLKYENKQIDGYVVFIHFFNQDCKPQSLIRWFWSERGII